jgi:hypothetical protein
MPLKLETPSSVTPRTNPEAVRTVGAKAGAVPAPVCAKVPTLIKRHSAKAGSFELTFAVLSCVWASYSTVSTAWSDTLRGYLPSVVATAVIALVALAQPA